MDPESGACMAVGYDQECSECNQGEREVHGKGQREPSACLQVPLPMHSPGRCLTLPAMMCDSTQLPTRNPPMHTQPECPGFPLGISPIGLQYLRGMVAVTEAPGPAARQVLSRNATAGVTDWHSTPAGLGHREHSYQTGHSMDLAFRSCPGASPAHRPFLLNLPFPTHRTRT